MSFRRLWMRLGKRIRRVRARFSRLSRRMIADIVLIFICGVALGSIVAATGLGVRAYNQRAKLRESLTQEKEREVEQLKNKLQEASGEDVVVQQELPWYLTLVNSEHPMEKDYDLQLTELEPGYSVDARIAKAAKRMLRDAEKAGMHIIICSAYRSVARQEQVFNESVADRRKQGMSYWESFKDTRMSVAEPGTSEHAMGLALDLISNQYTELDEKQEETKEARWLAENCSQYGFILRYPPSQTDITGIIYEPWHYRYVGVEDATKIMDLGITLEEYIAEYYGE